MLLRDRIRRFIVMLPDEPADHPSLIDELKLGELGKWSAGAMTLLAGTLGFLGMRGGALDRMLRMFPGPSILTFCLVGAAVLSAVIGPAIREGYRLRLLILVSGILALALAVAYTLPNIPLAPGTWREQFGGYYAYAAYLFFVSVGLVSWRARISLRGASFVVGVALLNFGIYSGVKLSVLSKLTVRVVPAVSVSLQHNTGAYVLQVRVRASSLATGQYVVLRLKHSQQDSWLRFDPDGLGQIDDQVSVPVAESAATVFVASQVCEAACNPSEATPAAQIALAQPMAAGTTSVVP